jgi:mediator of RNA polymerase II transcription subunit 17
MADQEDDTSIAATVQTQDPLDSAGAVAVTGATSQKEEFFKAKAEVLSNIGLAMNESALALDLVSLLISCVRPAAGTISMSAHLKKFVPPGSLNSDKIIKATDSEGIQERLSEDRLIGQGWKLSSLENTCVSLRNSAIRLIEEILKEKIFWDIIMKNFDNKEILYKTRDKVSGRRVFAVKYGYEDSGSVYKISGNAILKPVDGMQRLLFVPVNNSNNALVTSIKKILRVRILKKQPDEDDFLITGESTINDSFSKDDSIRSQIGKARFFIFEEELFSQLIDEANTLIAYDVKIENESKFTVETSDDEIVEIEAVEYNEDIPNEDEEFHVNERTENNRANIISSYLRLMLTIKYRKNLESKQQPMILKLATGPTSALLSSSSSSKLQSNSFSTILRPLVGQFRHEYRLEKLYSSLKDLIRDIPGSDLKFRKHSNLTKSQLQKDPLLKISTVPVTKFIVNVDKTLKIVILLDSFDYVNHIYHLSAFKRGPVFDDNPIVNIKFEELYQILECLEWIVEEYK